MEEVWTYENGLDKSAWDLEITSNAAESQKWGGSNNWAQLSCLFLWIGFILLWKFSITYLALSSGWRFVLIECCQGNDACGFSRCFGRDWRALSVCWWSYLGIRERHYVNLSCIKIMLISTTHVNLTGKQQFWAWEALLPDFPTHHQRTALRRQIGQITLPAVSSGNQNQVWVSGRWRQLEKYELLQKKCIDMLGCI